MRSGAEPVAPRADLGHAANFLFMLSGDVPDPERVRALETYLNTVVDHGLNASTFTARVIASTGSDLVSAVTGAIGALKGPLHGGAPGPALDMVFEIGEADRAEPYLRRKIEGGEKRARLVGRLVDAEIPVVGHIGLTPQSVHAMGGYKVQGKTLKAVEQLMHDALALERAGACCIVLEGIPREVAAMITGELEVPTIGIGAGPECDGQVLVFHDLLGLTFAPPAKFVRRYADVGSVISNALEAFKDDVKSGGYPSDGESYHLPKETLVALQAIAERKRSVQL